MLFKPGKWARVLALAMIGASAGMAAFAAQVTPPNPSEGSMPQEVNVSPSILSNYVGFYRFGPYSVMTVKLEGSQLSAQLTGQRYIPIFASGSTGFFTKVVKAHLDFVVDAQGRPTAMDFYQNGGHVTAPRIDAAAAQAVQAALDARVGAQRPYPQSERLLQVVLAHNPDAPELSPVLAELIREQKPKADIFLGKLGPVTSHEFIGVTPQGWDKYLVRHQNGDEEAGFLVDGNGTIVGAFRH